MAKETDGRKTRTATVTVRARSRATKEVSDHKDRKQQERAVIAKTGSNERSQRSKSR
jgi:hypothetical protein